MEQSKPLEFNGGALDYFILTILTAIFTYIPFFGWAFLLNYSGSWFADKALVNGKKVVFKAGYGESLKFVTVSVILIVITLGIYSFWFGPKLYKYFANHTQYADAAPVAPSPVTAPEASAEPITNPAPSVDTSSTDATPQAGEQTPEQPTPPVV
jgi:hypothetical protein